MNKKLKTLEEIKKVVSDGLNYITRKDFDYKKKEAEIQKVEAQINDFESKGFATEVEHNMLDNLVLELEQIDFDSNDILKEHIFMDNLAIKFGKLNGANIYTYEEASDNNKKLQESRDKFSLKMKTLEDKLTKAKEESDKDEIRLDIIKSERYVENIDKMINKFKVEFKDFIEVEQTLIDSINEVSNKLDALKTKHDSKSKELESIYLQLADETTKDENKDEIQNNINSLKQELEEISSDLPQHEIKLKELNSEKVWLGKQLTLPEKDFIGVDAKLKIWDKKKSDLNVIVTEMEKRLNVTFEEKKEVEGQHPLKNMLERTRNLVDTVVERFELEEERKLEEEQIEVEYKEQKKTGMNPFVISMLALGGYFALKK